MTFRLLALPLGLLLFAGTATAQERQWTLDASDQDAYLIFGVPESDDVGLSFWCPIRKGVVHVFIPEAVGTLPADKKVDVTMETGGQSVTLEGTTEVNEDAGVSSVEVQIPAEHAFLTALRASDRLKVTVAKEETVFPLFEADLEGLLSLCRKA